jgi:hypothetical protein
MSSYTISANGYDFGTYEGATAEDARNAYAKDAGYKDYADLCETIGTDPKAPALKIVEVES